MLTAHRVSRSLLILGLLFTATIGPTRAQAPTVPNATEHFDGYWEGAVMRDGAARVVRLEFFREGAQLRYRFESPDFPSHTFTPQAVRTDASGVAVALPMTGAFTLTLDAARQEITGAFRGAQPQPITLHLRRSVAPAPGYRRIDVTFPSGDVTIAGSLLLPPTAGPHPVVIWLSGRGSTLRQESLLTRHLAQYGIASLIYDKRGSGQSTGTFATATFDQLVQDATSAVQFLSTHREIDTKRIGLHGSSAGGWVAPVVATQSKVPVAFMMTTVGPAESLYDQQVHAYQAYVRTGGFELTPEEVVLSDEHIRRRLTLAFKNEGRDAFLETAAKVKSTRMERFLLSSDSDDAADFDWLRRNVADPVPHLKRIRVPWLAFYGTRDYVVPPQHNASQLERYLKEAGNTDITVVVLSDADHSMVVPNKLIAAGDTGAKPAYVFGRTPHEYTQTMVDWLRKRVRP